MKYKWLNKKNNEQLIVFFNGWGMDECVVNHLDCKDYDVLMFYDYNSLDTDFDFNTISLYTKKYLIAWSMGVMVGTLFDINFDSCTAINGTLKPIDDKYGIPLKIYNVTLRGFSLSSAAKFIKNMYDEPQELPVCSRNYESQKSELEALTKYRAKEDFKYNRVIISSNDKIIPTKNLTAYWGIEPNIKSGHAPFLLYKKWSELL